MTILSSRVLVDYGVKGVLKKKKGRRKKKKKKTFFLVVS